MGIEFVERPTRQIEYKKVCKFPLPHAQEDFYRFNHYYPVGFLGA
jgi:hypothetical protein